MNRDMTWSNRFLVYALKPTSIAVFYVLTALLWTLLLQHYMSYPFVFLFFGAVMASAWFGGYIAGFIAVVLASILTEYMLVPPYYSWTIARDSQSFFVGFLVTAITGMLISSSRARIEANIRDARDLLELRVQERTSALLQSNEEILERERQLREFTEAIPQQIWRAHANGMMEFCNHHLTDYTGCDLDTFITEGVIKLLHPLDRETFQVQWQRSLTEGSCFECEVRVRSNSGSWRWYLVRALPQRSSSGELLCWYGIHIDINEQRIAAQNVLVDQDSLARIQRIQVAAEMAASIAHELNQPLTALVMHAHACREWLNATPANLDRATATAERIVQESTRASSVVTRVRSLFRNDSSNESIIREETNLNSLLQSLIPLLRVEAVRRGILVQLKLDETLPAVSVDPIQMKQVLLNLVLNAMDAMDGESHEIEKSIVLSSRHHDSSQIALSVEDNGSGIDEQIAKQIFSPFFTTKRHGTGMGLTICQRIVESHGGKIWLEQPDNGGSRFSFTLPRLM